MSEHKFPIDYNCPWCGTDDRVYGPAIKEHGDGSDTEYSLAIIPLFNPNSTPPVVPKVMVQKKDLCRKCGREYTYRIEITTGQVKITPQQPPPSRRGGGPFPPFRLNG